MRQIRTRTGQSLAEYAVLFAIVVGAAVAMQTYVKSRLQGAVQAKADGYLNVFQDPGNSIPVPNAFEVDRNSDSTSSTSASMSNETAGGIAIDSNGNTTQNKQSTGTSWTP